MNKNKIISMVIALTVVSGQSVFAATNSLSQTAPAGIVANKLVNSVVTIKDKALENAIRNEISKPIGSLTKSDLAKVKKIYIWLETPVDLSGIEYCVNLENLTINGGVKNENSLSKLANLKYVDLELGRGAYFDLGVLQASNNLEFLSLRGFKIDAARMNNSKKLTNLSINECKVVNPSSIGSLISLQSISLCNTPIDSLKGLENLKKLLRLELNNCNVSDIRSLSGMSSLVDLRINGGKFTTIKPILVLKKLDSLRLEKCKSVKDFSNLNSLTSLTKLGIVESEFKFLIRGK